MNLGPNLPFQQYNGLHPDWNADRQRQAMESLQAIEEHMLSSPNPLGQSDHTGFEKPSTPPERDAGSSQGIESVLSQKQYLWGCSDTQIREFYNAGSEHSPLQSLTKAPVAPVIAESEPKLIYQSIYPVLDHFGKIVFNCGIYDDTIPRSLADKQ